MASSELMPDLRLVPVERIRFHEHPERRRTRRLVKRIRQDAFLRNPPIVAAMNDGHFLLLDGANRVGAFAELGFSHVPVQVVDYGDERIQLKGWHHLRVNNHPLELRRPYEALPGVTLRPVEPPLLLELLERREVLAILVDETTACWGLFPPGEGSKLGIHDRIAVLEQVVGAYEGQSRLERIKLADFSLLPDVIRSVGHQLCLFPVFSKEELLGAVRRSFLRGLVLERKQGYDDSEYTLPPEVFEKPNANLKSENFITPEFFSELKTRVWGVLNEEMQAL